MKIKKIIKFLKTHKFFFVIISLFLTAAIFSLNKELFIDWDECLYSVYPWEMRKTGNYLVNQWNGYLDFQKPPLYSWLLQIPFLLGRNEFYPRLISLLASLLLLIVFYFFSFHQISQLTATASVFFIFLSDIFIFYSQKLNTDIFYTLFIFLGFVFWIKKDKKINLFLAGFFFALAVMVKGLSVLPFLLAIFLSLFLKRDKKDFVHFIFLITTFLIFIIPWHLLVWFKYKNNFIQVYFIENLLQRSRYPIELHFGGKKFYLETLLRQYSLWLILIFYCFFSIWRKKENFLKKIDREKLSLTIFLLFFVPLFFLTYAKTKIAWYLMPIYPFLSLFLAMSLERFLKNKSFFIKIIFLTILSITSFLNIKKHTLYQKKSISPKNEVALKAKETPYNKLYFLVPYYERTAKALLDQSPHLKISSTFVYGGNPCMVYYSQKKVYYFYSIEEFKQILKNPGLFLVENNDLPLIKDLPTKLIYRNKQFTLFELKTNP